MLRCNKKKGREGGREKGSSTDTNATESEHKHSRSCKRDENPAK
jgi:hypothetical protein